MRVSKSPFESYKSKQILVFANLICSSVSGPKALKKLVCVLRSEELQNIFEIGSKKFGAMVQKSFSEKNISKEKIHRHVFDVYMLN